MYKLKQGLDSLGKKIEAARGAPLILKPAHIEKAVDEMFQLLSAVVAKLESLEGQKGE